MLENDHDMIERDDGYMENICGKIPKLESQHLQIAMS